MTAADLASINARVVIATSDVACLLAGLRAVAEKAHS